MQNWRSGRAILMTVAGFTTVGGYIIDMNRTHMYNPRWTAHAKFHDAQTILLGTLLGASSLVCLWRKGGDQHLQLSAGALLLACFWVSMGASILFPNTAVADPEFADALPTIAGLQLNPVTVSLAMLLLIGCGYNLERRRLTMVDAT
jgi:hypothetical protein